MKKRAMVALLVFIIATLEIVFGWKKTVQCKRSLGDNNIINPARYTQPYFGHFLLFCVRPVFFRPLESHTNWHFSALDLMDRRKLMSGWHPIMMPWMLQIRFVINVYVIHSTQFCHVRLICLSYLSYLQFITMSFLVAQRQKELQTVFYFWPKFLLLSLWLFKLGVNQIKLLHV